MHLYGNFCNRSFQHLYFPFSMSLYRKNYHLSQQSARKRNSISLLSTLSFFFLTRRGGLRWEIQFCLACMSAPEGKANQKACLFNKRSVWAFLAPSGFCISLRNKENNNCSSQCDSPGLKRRLNSVPHPSHFACSFQQRSNGPLSLQIVLNIPR